MGVGARSVTSMVVERYLRVEKAKIKPKITLRPNKRLQGQTGPKSAKMPNQKLQSQERSKKPNLT